MPCTKLVELLKAEKIDLESEIERDKWFLSQQQHRNVGRAYAEYDFINKYLSAWAEGYKKCYCSLVCPDRKKCGK